MKYEFNSYLFKRASVIVLIIASCFSCKNDDDSVAVNPSLYGIWELREIVSSVGSLPLDECQLQVTITFSENGTLLRYNTFTMEEPCGFTDSMQEYYFTENGFFAYYTFDGGQDVSYEVEFITLNETTLEFKNIWNGDFGTLEEEEQTTRRYERL